MKNHHLIESLKEIQAKTIKSENIAIREIFSSLAGRGYAVLLILLSFPFAIPIQIPGFSTPFGLIMAFLGLRIAFGKQLWWPEWILNREIPSASIAKLIDRLIAFFESDKMHFLKPRLQLFLHPFFHYFNGMLIFLLALILALPLPIPFTNMLTATPILCIALGLLEDDGLFIAIGYGISALLATGIMAFALYFAF